MCDTQLEFVQGIHHPISIKFTVSQIGDLTSELPMSDFVPSEDEIPSPRESTSPHSILHSLRPMSSATSSTRRPQKLAPTSLGQVPESRSRSRTPPKQHQQMKVATKGAFRGEPSYRPVDMAAVDRFVNQKCPQLIPVDQNSVAPPDLPFPRSKWQGVVGGTKDIATPQKGEVYDAQIVPQGASYEVPTVELPVAVSNCRIVVHKVAKTSVGFLVDGDVLWADVGAQSVLSTSIHGTRDKSFLFIVQSDLNGLEGIVKSSNSTPVVNFRKDSGGLAGMQLLQDSAWESLFLNVARRCVPCVGCGDVVLKTNGGNLPDGVIGCLGCGTISCGKCRLNEQMQLDVTHAKCSVCKVISAGTDSQMNEFPTLPRNTACLQKIYRDVKKNVLVMIDRHKRVRLQEDAQPFRKRAKNRKPGKKFFRQEHVDQQSPVDEKGEARESGQKPQSSADADGPTTNLEEISQERQVEIVKTVKLQGDGQRSFFAQYFDRLFHTKFDDDLVKFVNEYISQIS